MFSSFLVELLGSMLLQTDIVIGSFQIAELVQKLATTIWQTSEQEDVASSFQFSNRPRPDLSMVEQNLLILLSYKCEFCETQYLSCNNLVMNKQNFWYRKKSKLLSLHISTAMLLAAKHFTKEFHNRWYLQNATFQEREKPKNSM